MRARVMVGVLVLAATTQDPRPFRDDVEEGLAPALGVAATELPGVRVFWVVLEPMPAEASRLLPHGNALLFAAVARPRYHVLEARLAARLGDRNQIGTVGVLPGCVV
eukprot:CAMPEP_0202043394 /NCGR_PEP_ID=MMETSP0962-20130828/30160_1 /ASSEMBLY_ACC=CAM_ASM_000488 /TAXON_ID=4773 /ORGANISM="Schizochytrium aggregatum, Strain ATCC28209" /LENGTH=106 /DNA_ID=CAMNT_0048607875 /DNA_START=151 /DNA_END=468 /DNA_ORIENTATION=+